MREILDNAHEFLESTEDNIKKERWNAAVSDFFKAIAAFCDYLIYKEIKRLPKKHSERFSLLEKYFNNVYQKVTELFKKYRESYNLRLKKEDALKSRAYAYELRDFIKNKE